ncbi:hypothetical protein U1Q18_008841 [Sarracenia purpurea var. burkii]
MLGFNAVGANPRVCLPWTSRPSLVRRRPRPWVFRRRRWTGVPPCANPRVCLPWTSRPWASVPRPSATFGLAIDSLVRRCPRPWVRRASLVSPPTLDWGSALLLWFRRRRRTGAVSVRLRRLGWFNRNLGLLGSPGLLPVEKAEVCVLIYLDGEESS